MRFGAYVFSKLAAALDHLAARASWRALGTQRCLAIAALIAVTVFGTLHVLQPPPPKTAGAVVAAHDLAVGTVVAASDLKMVQVPPGIMPQAALSDKSQITGETVTAPVPAGLIITPAALAGPDLYSSVPAGTVATPVRFSDPELVQLLRPGDRINVLVTRQAALEVDTAEVVARRALVLATPNPEEESGGILGVTPTNSGNFVILAVPEAQAAALAAASQMGALSIALVE